MYRDLYLTKKKAKWSQSKICWVLQTFFWKVDLDCLRTPQISAKMWKEVLQSLHWIYKNGAEISYM